jgi:acyl transferase domain-containing protein
MDQLSERIAGLSPTKRALLALELQSKLEAIDRLRDEPIAIIGIGCRFPGAVQGPESFWQLLCNGVDAITEVPPERWNAQSYYDPDPAAPGKTNTRWGGFLDAVALFDARFFGVSPREAERMDPQQRLLLEVSWEALENAGLAPERLRGTKTGVFIGISNSDYIRMRIDDPKVLDAFAGTGNVFSIAANRLSYFYDFHGPSMAIDAACSSSLTAAHLACQSLRSGESDLALVGGVNLILSPEIAISLAKIGLMSPTGRCRPFDAAADGYVRSEGAAVIALKPLSKAMSDGDRIYAVIRGSAVNQNGRQSNGLTAPSQKFQEEVLREAYRRAGVSPSHVQYVEAMALGTTLGDAIEAKALGSVLASGRAPGEPCVVGAVKSNIGHLEAASGMAALIKAALSLKHKQIPPSLHYARPNPYIPLGELPLRMQNRLGPWPEHNRPALAGVSSTSFGGVNVHVVLEEAPTAAPGGESRPCQLLLLSAQTDSALDKATANLAAYLRNHHETPLADIAYTLKVGRNAFDHRRAFVCRDVEDAVMSLENHSQERARTSIQTKRDRPVLFMFPGQELPCWNSVRALYQAETAFRDNLDLCAEILGSLPGFDPRWILGPIEREGRIETPPPRRLEINHAALFAVEYALAKLWMEWGARPEAMIGHGIGEYVAACLAGVFSLSDALALIVKRARLIQNLPAETALASPLRPEEIEPLLDDRLSLAAIDQPGLCTVSGAPDVVSKLNQLLRSRGIKCERVPGDLAFHSKAMEPICGDLRQLVASVERKAPQIPYLSTATGAWIKAEDAIDPAYWGRQVCQPIRFAEAIGQALTDAERIFIEVGPGQSLCSNVRLHPGYDGERGLHAIPSLPGADDQQSAMYGLMRAVGELWLEGARIDWDAFYSREKRQRLSLPTYPFERQRYWLDAGGSERLHSADSATCGEIDEKSEPASGALHARPALATAYESSRNDYEHSVAQIWQSLLGIEQIGVHDDFLELGGNSLLATQLFSRLRKVFQVELPLQDMLQMRTVAVQANFISTIHWISQEQDTLVFSHMREGAAIEGEL